MEQATSPCVSFSVPFSVSVALSRADASPPSGSETSTDSSRSFSNLADESAQPSAPSKVKLPVPILLLKAKSLARSVALKVVPSSLELSKSTFRQGLENTARTS
jgi:hypothetical protein